MIDELVKVANALKTAGVSTVDWHEKLKTLPNVSKQAPCIRVWLTHDGHINALELLSKELVSQLRKYEPDYGKSLPGLNVRTRFRVVLPDDNTKASRGKECEALMQKWVSDFWLLPPDQQEEFDFWPKTRTTLQQCFGRVSEDLLRICEGGLETSETLRTLLGAVGQINLGQFQKELTDALWAKVQAGELPLSSVFYFVTEEKIRQEDANPRAPVPKLSLFLDVKDYVDYPVAHSKTMLRLNTLLMCSRASELISNTGADLEYDAYGLDAQKKEDKFPGVALPSLGGVILRSQVKSIPCQKRYHLCESETFPAGVETRQRVKAALEWIGNKNHEGQTYGKAGDSELLFAYPSVLHQHKVPLARMFGAHPEANLNEERFENIAKGVIDQLKGIERQSTNDDIEIFSLRKMDKARTKVVYYRNTTVARFEEASLAWSDGCQNIPRLAVLDWNPQKNGITGKPNPVRIESLSVFPVKLHLYLNAVWKRDGSRADTKKSKVSIFQPTDGLRLLLDDPCDALATHMMERFMFNAQGYFITLCRCVGNNEVSSLKDKDLYPGILGLLLFKLGKRKEKYMSESAFLLGRCLRVADELHRLYCVVVRKGQLPPELCGSSLLVGMMESPGMALSQLAMRSAPYVKWARGGSDKADKGGLVWYWLRQLEEINDQLHALQWPSRMTPDERAQVFLGFLSSFAKREDLGGIEKVDANKEGELK